MKAFYKLERIILIFFLIIKLSPPLSCCSDTFSSKQSKRKPTFSGLSPLSVGKVEWGRWEMSLTWEFQGGWGPGCWARGVAGRKSLAPSLEAIYYLLGLGGNLWSTELWVTGENLQLEGVGLEPALEAGRLFRKELSWTCRDWSSSVRHGLAGRTRGEVRGNELRTK